MSSVKGSSVDDATKRLKIYKLLDKSSKLEFLWARNPDRPDSVEESIFVHPDQRITFNGHTIWPTVRLPYDELSEPVYKLLETFTRQPDPNHWGHILATVSRWASARKLVYRAWPEGYEDHTDILAPYETWTRKNRLVEKPKTYPKGTFNHVVDTPPDFSHQKWVQYFEFLKLRMEVWHRKDVLKQPPPWTEDTALQNYFFTNIYRELDRNTRFELSFLEKEKDPQEQLRKILVFRQHNSPWVFDLMMENPTEEEYNRRYTELHQEGHGASRAMIINTPRFESVQSWSWKFFQWVQENIDRVYADISVILYENEQDEPAGAKAVYDYLLTLPRIGNFFAYEFYTSLTYTNWFPYTEDSYVWCGPGAAPALEYMLDLPTKVLKRDRTPAQIYVDRYSELVRNHIIDHVPDYRWIPEGWQPESTREPQKFTKRTFEHSLCEYRKWVNTSDGGKRCRRRPYPRV